MRNTSKLLKSLVLAGLCFWLFAQGSSCKDTGITPPEKKISPDTTSHAFVWKIDTIGAQGVLYDVAIIDENNIWAVGEIYLRDSTGQIDPLLYNVARWDGIQWNIFRVTVNFRGNPVTPSLQGVFCFSSTEIWLAASGSVIQGNGSAWTLHDVRLETGFDSLSFTKGWGANSSSMYFVGRNGSIVYFNGSSWQKIESGTTVDLKDIFGESTGDRILTVASSVSDTRVLTLANGAVIGSITWPVGLRSLWISSSSTAYLSGVGGLWKETDTSWTLMEGLPDTVFSGVVRGNADNDLFVNVHTPAHFNGGSWRFYSEFPMDFSFQSLTVKQDIVIAVGFTITGGFFADKPAIVIGKRIH